MVGQGLSGRCGLVVANKADLAEGRANLPRLKEEAATLGLRIVGAVSTDRLQMVVLDGCASNTSAAVVQSAKLGDNLERVVAEMLGLCRAAGRRKRQRID